MYVKLHEAHLGKNRVPVKLLPTLSSVSTISAFKSMFARYGVPSEVKDLTDSALVDFKPKEDFNCVRTVRYPSSNKGNFHRLTVCDNTVNDYENVQSINMAYKINVHRHTPSVKNETDEIYASEKNNNSLVGQPTKLDEWSFAVKNKLNGQDILIIDVGNFTERIVDHVIKSGMLNEIQQLSIRISYGDPKSGIKYLSALKHLRKLFEVGFRIYWSRQEWSGILQNNKNRTSCVYLDMADRGHLRIPEDKEILKLTAEQRYALYISINWDFSFDDVLVETYGCDIHSFDPSMNSPDFRRGDNIWFHNLGIGGKTSKKGTWNVSTLEDILHHLNHAFRRVDILKMDVETMEWESFPNIIETGALANIRQMLIEFHGTSASLKQLRTLRDIYNEGFRIFWYHRNPAASNLRQGIFVQNTACYEVYFVRV
ncbi:unnamed protein product [Mytilus coruscus]|uniref:Methyltransferase domain-containing protein n=1 Tax=Mytilus coruscus TaxID=42192 RepID=A0A6J8BJ18_MYTCO|nr:unnamed protein product [Mytilus coruscus]